MLSEEAPKVRIWIDTDVGSDGLNPGDTLNYTFDVTNTGDVTVTGVVINEVAFDLPGPIVITAPADVDLSPGETQQWTGVYTLTQADIDSNYASADQDVDNLASATGNNEIESYDFFEQQ